MRDKRKFVYALGQIDLSPHFYSPCVVYANKRRKLFRHPPCILEPGRDSGPMESDYILVLEKALYAHVVLPE